MFSAALLQWNIVPEAYSGFCGHSCKTSSSLHGMTKFCIWEFPEYCPATSYISQYSCFCFSFNIMLFLLLSCEKQWWWNIEFVLGIKNLADISLDHIWQIIQDIKPGEVGMSPCCVTVQVVFNMNVFKGSWISQKHTGSFLKFVNLEF